MVEANDKLKEITLNQCINWLEDALYDIQCGSLHLGESLLHEAIQALRELDAADKRIKDGFIEGVDAK